MNEEKIKHRRAQMEHDEAQKRAQKEHELTLEAKRWKIAFWSAQTASLEKLDQVLEDSDK